MSDVSLASFMLTGEVVAAAPETTLLQYGVLGIVVLFLGYFAWSTIKRERAKADEYEQRLNALHESIRTEIVPTITRATDALARLADYLADDAPAPPSKRRS